MHSCTQADAPLRDCRINGVTFFDAELHGKGTTGCGSFDGTSKSITSCSRLQNLIY